MSEPNVFSDDDLKRLKEYLYCDHKKTEGCLHPIYGPPLIDALIARLEAAEAYIFARSDNPYQVSERYDAWKKACGK